MEMNKRFWIVGMVVMLLIGGVGGYQYHIYRVQTEAKEFLGLNESAADEAADKKFMAYTSGKNVRG